MAYSFPLESCWDKITPKEDVVVDMYRSTGLPSISGISIGTKIK